MRDIPVFSTELGVASLLIKDVPNSGTAYIKIRSSMEADAFLKECIGFCKAVGATRILACGDDCLQSYAHFVDVLIFKRDQLEDEDIALLFPVQEHTLDLWLDIYNKAMVGVTMASRLTRADGIKLIKEGSAYFVHQDNRLLGIGVVSEGLVEAIAACEAGCGKIVMKTLCSALSSDVVCVEVASDNTRAIRLYEKLGFVNVGIKESWYQVT